jgi:hypothetical protein
LAQKERKEYAKALTDVEEALKLYPIDKEAKILQEEI